MTIVVTSIFVEDQERALDFYTTKLGFVKKHDVPMGKTDGLRSCRPNSRTASSCC